MREPDSLPTNVSLLRRISRAPSDPGAWDEFVPRYSQKIYAWCRQWGLQDADARDVTQDVLLRLTQRLQRFTYDPARSFRAWLRKLTRDAWCDWQRAAGRRAALEQLATEQAGDDLVRQLDEQAEADLLEEASARVQLQVEPKTWEAFRLLTFEQLSGAAAAERLGTSVGNVFVARSRVRKLMQQALRDLDPPEA
jgi:RNA polymerase sigma factor (sigma-70 family)